jgi:ABC-type multidrug transport system fused ATPase/permease subunit
MLGSGASVYVLITVGGKLVMAGLLSVGELAAFTALLGTMLPPLRSLGWMLSVWQRGHAGLARIFELIDAPIDRPEGRGAPVPPPAPEIEFRALDFAYPDRPDERVLHGVTARIAPGTTVGIFGRTGSGKTTLLRALTRLYNPPAGSVRVGGDDLMGVDLDAWRARMAVVPQRPFLYSDTIRANVALDPQPDEVLVARAVKLAALEPDVAVLPDGLDTVVGERGIMLSGGQRQRVALARGLYRFFRGGVDLVVLDDVLSSVDHATEAQLVETLDGLGRGGTPPTVVLVSHRLSALRHADNVLVLDGGRLIDQGRHDDLVARPGPYRDAWRVQTGALGAREGVA